MENCLYLECLSGISGDMTAAALLDLGADRQVLQRALDSLDVAGFSVKISRVKKSGLDVCDFDVILDEAHENHDHDMEYLHGHEKVSAAAREDLHGGHDRSLGESHPHDHVHDIGEDHEHDHAHDAGEGHMHDHAHDVGEGHLHDHAHDAGEGHMHDHAHDAGEGHMHDHAHGPGEDHPHGQEEGHAHGHAHGHGEGHTHAHEHRGMKEILSIIRHADMTDHAKQIAERIFSILAEAEAEAHGVSPEEVHFHEVGAVDSIVDIITVAVCLDNLGITQVAVPKLYEGSGTIRCQHGIIPVPVPAVASIAKTHRLSLKITETQGELVTPTGAAIVAAIRTMDRLPEEFTIQKTGMGAGKRNYDRPGILRAMLIRTADSGKKAADQICKLETNIDDCTGEMLGYVLERLFAAGARDAHYIPVFMKKNRPAYQLDVICSPEDADVLERIIFEETTTIGIRRVLMDRTVLKRRGIHVETSLGKAAVKVCSLEEEERYYPEYDSVVELAREHGLSFGEVYELVKKESRGKAE